MAKCQVCNIKTDMTTTTVNITFPGGEEEYTTIHATEPTIAEHTDHTAVNIDGGVIQNPSILVFQEREPHYPHAHIL